MDGDSTLTSTPIPVSADPIGRRWRLIAGTSAVGAAAFVPFLTASAPGLLTPPQVATFIAAAAIAAALSAWGGLRFADRADLPMPLLRAWERRSALPVNWRGIASALAVGAAFGVLGILLLGALHAPPLAGSLAIRLASVLFAAVTLETVVHLLVMSAVVRLSGHVWLGVVAGALAFVLFHASGSAGLPPALPLVALATNGIGGLLFGWLYARYGFEYLVIAHAAAHLLTVGLG